MGFWIGTGSSKTRWNSPAYQDKLTRRLKILNLKSEIKNGSGSLHSSSPAPPLPAPLPPYPSRYPKLSMVDLSNLGADPGNQPVGYM
jgi:hypothetical protein